jgi:hypothetical protein
MSIQAKQHVPMNPEYNDQAQDTLLYNPLMPQGNSPLKACRAEKRAQKAATNAYDGLPGASGCWL